MRALVAALLAVLALAAQAQERTLSVAARESGDRLALVIGNSAYKVGALRNPANDARAMAAALKSSGFDVTHGENLSHRQMFEMTRDFGRKLRPGSVALFYYAGHGLQVRDRNFLIPVEADVQSEEEVPYTSVDVNYLLDVMNRAKSRINIVILDACRNNPFARSWRSSSTGLAQMEAPSGTLIAYATAPGRVASDGTGAHGLYTQHLLKHLATPGLPVEILFKRVREDVERETKSQQIPWESSSLKGDFFFTAAAPVAPVAPAAAPAATDAAFTTELAFWDAIKASQSAADYEAYLDTYPKGRFAALARARANSLKVAAAAAPAVAAPAPAPQRPAQVAAVAPTPVATGRLPAVGDRWVYRYTDLWRPAERIEVTHAVTAVSSQEITESLSTASRRKHSEEAVWPVASTMGQWTLEGVVMREFSPYALALGIVRPGEAPQGVKGLERETADTPEWSVRTSMHEEEVSVPAGTFRAVKVLLQGTRATQNNVGQMHTFQMAIWYAPQSSRAVKVTFDSRARVGNSFNAPLNRDVYELVSAPQGAAPATASAPQRPAQVAAVAPTPVASGKLPASGERWVYRHTDEWTSRRTEITHQVTAASGAGVTETVSATLASGRVTTAVDWPASLDIRAWTLGSITLRELNPFALAFEALRPGMVFSDVRGMPFEQHTPEWTRITAKVLGEEEIAVPAGRFRALKVEIAGQRQMPSRPTNDAGKFLMTVWYAPEAKRHVKMSFYSFTASVAGAASRPVNSTPMHRETYELVSAPAR